MTRVAKALWGCHEVVIMMGQEGAERKNVSEDLRFALMMQECWKKEIEKAIENVKSKKGPSDLDKWVKWYKRLEKGRKKKTEDVRSVFRVQ